MELPSPTFAEAVAAYMKPYEGLFNYAIMANGHLDISRFYPLIQSVAAYKSIAGTTVFSSGCSSAGELQVCLEMGAKKVYGIEVNEGLATLARSRFQNTVWAPRVDIQTYTGLASPYPDAMFDVILSIHVVEHTSDNELYLTELARVLKPGGIIFLDVPSRYYYLEQHTALPFIHFLPRRIRNLFIQGMLWSPIRRWLSEEMAYKIGTLQNYHFPSPGDLRQFARRERSADALKVQDAIFHSYTDITIPYAERLRRISEICRTMTTFRLVITKSL